MKLGTRTKRQAKALEVLRRVEDAKDDLKFQLAYKHDMLGKNPCIQEDLFNLAYKYGKGDPKRVEVFYAEMSEIAR